MRVILIIMRKVTGDIVEVEINVWPRKKLIDSGERNTTKLNCLRKRT